MRQLGIVEFVTLDGVMEGLAGSGEDGDGGFDYAGWGGAYADRVLAERAGAGVGQTTAYLFGRRTYEHMAAHWPNEPEDDPIAASLNSTPKYVATRTLRKVEWGNSHILGADLVGEIQRLKTEGEGFITVLGSGDLVQTLIAHDLVDVFRIFIHPLVLGSGKQLFRSADRPLPLRLVECIPTTTGVLLCTYERAT